MRTGIIYKWTCTNPDIPEFSMSYIGQTKRPEKRYKAHINSKDGSWFHRTLSKYGVESFSYEVIYSFTGEEQELTDKLNEMEQYYIKFYNTYPYWNQTPGGEGFVMSEEGKKKNVRHNKWTEEHRRNYIKARKGKPNKMPDNFSEIQKKAAQIKWLFKAAYQPVNVVMKSYDDTKPPKTLSEETKEKIKKTKAERGINYIGENNPMYGQGYKLAGDKNGRYGTAKYINVKQYTLDGEFVKEWHSCYEASKTLGLHHIENSIEGKNKHIGGYIWKADLNPKYIQVKSKNDKNRLQEAI